MTPHQVHLVQSSFQALRPMAPAVGRLFYERVFALRPDVKAMFSADPATHGARLMGAMGIVIDALEGPAEVTPLLLALGQRHQVYGVTQAHYALGGQVLLATLGEALGDDLDPATEQAWAVAYGWVAATMLQGAEAAADMAPDRAA